MTLQLHWLDADAPPDAFPDVAGALREPPGLLAAGGDLSPQRLLAAYRRGIFPWYEQGQPILWWSPDPRTVLVPGELRVSRRLARRIRRREHTVSIDRDFGAVVAACRRPRRGQRGTWITPAMEAAYLELHRLGHAHSVEVWQDGALCGGIYGVAIGQVYFGESMFSRRPDGSKIALAYLVRWFEQWGYRLIDCQVTSPHLVTLGATQMARETFTAALARWCALVPAASSWQAPTPAA